MCKVMAACTMSCQLSENGKENLVSNVKDILYRYGFWHYICFKYINHIPKTSYNTLISSMSTKPPVVKCIIMFYI